MQKKTDRQKQARQLATDYLGFLMDQERLVRQVVDERVAELQPELEALVDERIRQQLKKHNK